MKKLLIVLTFTSFFLLPQSVLAQNKFGIHVSQTEDLTRAAELVNSNAGDWGYVTIVIQETDRNYEKWQNFFDLCREKHLIPLVRIATRLENETWRKPSPQDIGPWVDFLDSLNWPIKQRVVIIYNEPNHDKEWGGAGNAAEYALVLDRALRAFPEKNPDFLVLNAGFDQAAPNSQTTIDEYNFLRQMEDSVPKIFTRLKGWASHSYPNHGFIGKPWETGKASVKGYQWEISVLKSLGANQDLPIFITETGWPHNGKFYSDKLTAEYFKLAFEEVWLKDEKVQAVTPFILNYPFFPFDNFSWLDSSGEPYIQFETVKSLAKTKGDPFQEEKFTVTDIAYPRVILAGYEVTGQITLKNTGQSIWGEKEFSVRRIVNSLAGVSLSDLYLPKGIKVKPQETYRFEFSLEAPKEPGQYSFSWEGLPEYQVKVVSFWKISVKKTSILARLLQKVLELSYRFNSLSH
jgi:hypothetical protein